MSVLDALKRKSGFTRTEAELADYIVRNADAAAAMSVSKLARASFTSSATVVRLCHKLGLDGYRAFRIQLVSDLERSRATMSDVDPDMPFAESEGTRSMISAIASLKKRAVDETYATLDTHEVQKAARMVTQARRVVLYAVGDSAVTAAAFANYLLKIGIVCCMANQYGDTLAIGSTLEPTDVAIVVSYSGRQFETMARELRGIRNRGCKIIAVTSDAGIRERMADIGCLLLCPSAESIRDKIATYYAQTCMRFALECVFGECFSRDYQGNVRRVSRYDDSRPGMGQV